MTFLAPLPPVVVDASIAVELVLDGSASIKAEWGSWIDQDRLYVGFAFDSTTMTTSGYSRVVKEWRRGTPLSAAPQPRTVPN